MGAGCGVSADAMQYALGATEPLVAVIRYGTGDGQAYAAAALGALSDNKEAILLVRRGGGRWIEGWLTQQADRFGVVPPLVSLLLNLTGINENEELQKSLRLSGRAAVGSGVVIRGSAAIEKSQKIPMAAMSALWVHEADKKTEHRQIGPPKAGSPAKHHRRSRL